jgi:hypothetical protein
MDEVGILPKYRATVVRDGCGRMTTTRSVGTRCVARTCCRS